MRPLIVALSAFCCLLAAARALAQAPPRAEAKPLRVVLIYDFEGITGVTDPMAIGTFAPDLYAEARKSLTADVNAAVAGLKAAGATEVLVVDGHGSGNSEGPDILDDQLTPPAKMLFRDHPYDPYMDPVDASVDAVVGVGFHAGGDNERGFLSHTLTVENTEFKVNGVKFDESMILAVAAARYRVPLIMVSGDDQLQAEVSRMLPWVKCAVVKRAVSRSKCEPVAREEASKRIEATAREALANLARAGLPDCPTPYRFALKLQTERMAGAAAMLPGAELQQDKITVQFRANDFEEGYLAARRVLKVVSVYGWEEASASVMEGQTNGKELEKKVIAWWLDRWLGTLPPPEESGPEAEQKPRHWGAK